MEYQRELRACKKLKYVNFIYSEKATKFCEIFTLLLSYVVPLKSSDAASGWAGWALAYPEFGSSVNPTTTRGADYAHHITASPPGFENSAASLQGYDYELHKVPSVLDMKF